MGPLTRRPRYLDLVVMLFLGSLGCSHTPVGPSPLPAEVREHLGRIGVAYDSAARLWVDAKPLRGAGPGARRGALIALGGVVEMLTKSPGDPRGVAGLIMLSPGIVAVGALVGAASAPSAAAVAEAETVLAEVVADPDLLVTVRTRLLQAVHCRRPDAVPVLPVPDTAAEEKTVAQAVRSHAGVDTVLEIYGPTIGLRKGPGAGAINPSLQLSVRLRTRVIRTPDGEVLSWFGLVYEGETRTFTEWAANHGQPFREEVDRAVESLIQQIVAHLFGTESSDAKREDTP